MFIQLLSFVHNLTTLLFGIFISAFFLGVKQNRRNILRLFIFFSFEGIIYITCFLLLGKDITNRLYAGIVHLPLVLFLTLYYKYSLLSSGISVVSAYLCCQLSNWIGIVILSITDALWCYYVSRVFITCISFILLSKMVCRTTEIIFCREDRELYIIGFLPSVYYLFDYMFTKLSDFLYSGSKAVVEFMGFSFCICYLAFLFVYFREYETRQEMNRYNNLMEIQLSSIMKEIEQVKHNKQSLSILRHDMRHHLNLIMTQLQNNNIKQAVDYIIEISDTYDDTVITVYCKNEMINSIVSIYYSRFVDKEIALNCNISVGSSLPCPDIAICTILSNALENALHALEEENTEKWVSLTISQKENHLLLRIENPIVRPPHFVDGIPVSRRKGHGLGVKSIVYYTEMLHGQCQFSVSNRIFLLRIII